LQSAGKIAIGTRGEGEIEPSPFVELYENEQETKRVLGELKTEEAEDFTINENPAYAFALLKDFFKNKKVTIADQSEVIGTEVASLRPVESIDTGDAVGAKYELEDEVDGTKFTEEVEVTVKLGTTVNDKLTVQIRLVKGNWFYFKKIAVEVKNLFAYCKV
jgi:hypothetical protein